MRQSERELRRSEQKEDVGGPHQRGVKVTISTFQVSPPAKNYMQSIIARKVQIPELSRAPSSLYISILVLSTKWEPSLMKHEFISRLSSRTHNMPIIPNIWLVLLYALFKTPPNSTHIILPCDFTHPEEKPLKIFSHFNDFLRCTWHLSD